LKVLAQLGCDPRTIAPTTPGTGRAALRWQLLCERSNHREEAARAVGGVPEGEPLAAELARWRGG
jgi:hypothetical protein